MGHTPTPWQVDEVRTQVGRAFRIGSGEMLKAGKGCCIIYDDYPGRPDNERAANAAYIVECVNSHASLVEEVERLREALKRIRDATPLNTNAKDAAEMCNHTYAISASALLYDEDRSNA